MATKTTPRTTAAATTTAPQGTSAKVISIAAKTQATKTAEAAKPAVVTKITGLTGNQPSALSAALSEDEAKRVTIKATTAEFAMTAAEAEALVRRAQERMAVHGRQGGPYQTLHAVVRKVAAAAKAQQTKADAKPAATPAARDTKDAPTAAHADAKAPAKDEVAGLKALHATSERAAKAATTHAEALKSSEKRTCAACGQEKAITAFPTTSRNKDGVMGRGKKCRACRDGKTKAAAKK